MVYLLLYLKSGVLLGLCCSSSIFDTFPRATKFQIFLDKIRNAIQRNRTEFEAEGCDYSHSKYRVFMVCKFGKGILGGEKSRCFAFLRWLVCTEWFGYKCTRIEYSFLPSSLSFILSLTLTRIGMVVFFSYQTNFSLISSLETFSFPFASLLPRVLSFPPRWLAFSSNEQLTTQ